VLFVDSDDWIEPDMVERLVTLAKEYQSGFVMCSRVINHTATRGSLQIIHRLSKKQAIHDFLRHEYFVGSLWNRLFSNSLVNNIVFPQKISYG